MKAFISLAISMLLVGLLYVYVRQQFALLETHVDELKRVIKMLALPQEEVKLVEVKVEKRPSEPELIDVSDDDTDEETDEETETEEDDEKELTEIRPQVAHVMMQGHDLMQLMQQMSFPTYEHEPALEFEEVDVSEPNESKVVVLEDKGYENMTVKELKDKVQLIGGPSLKTKKQLVEYLEKNVSN
jgi:hypothetical protein